MIVNRDSTEEYFEIIKFIEDNAPFTMLLGKPWIERDHAKRQEEEEVLEQKKQELKEFMTRRITHLLEEQKNRLTLLALETQMSKLQQHYKNHKILK
jgi:hypothetical protein